jgi:hypothetical protein
VYNGGWKWCSSEGVMHCKHSDESGRHVIIQCVSFSKSSSPFISEVSGELG